MIEKVGGDRLRKYQGEMSVGRVGLSHAADQDAPLIEYHARKLMFHEPRRNLDRTGKGFSGKLEGARLSVQGHGHFKIGIVLRMLAEAGDKK